MPFILLNYRSTSWSSLNANGWYERRNWLVSFVVGVCGSIMWRKASAAALLALAVGYFYHGSPDLPEQILQYISLPNFQLSSQSQNSQNSLEQVISAAWETLITLPTRQWNRVAVGWVRQLNNVIVSFYLSLHRCSCSRSMVHWHVERLLWALLLRRNVSSWVSTESLVEDGGASVNEVIYTFRLL